MWGNNIVSSEGMLPGRKFFGPLFLVCVTPIFVHLFWYTNFHLDGSFSALFQSIMEKGFVEILKLAIPSPFTLKAWKIILTFMTVQAILMRVVPGKEYTGPMTSQGN